MWPGSHPISPRVHNTTCPSRRVALLPERWGALPRPGRKADARAKRVGSPSPISPPFLSRPLGPCRRLSLRKFRPGSPHPLFAPLRFVAHIRPITPGAFAQAPLAGTEGGFEPKLARLVQNRPFALRPSAPIAQSFSPRRPRPNLERREVLPRPEASRPGGSRDLSFAHRPAHLHPS